MVKIGLIFLMVLIILSFVIKEYGFIGALVSFVLVAVIIAAYDYRYRPESERKKK